MEALWTVCSVGHPCGNGPGIGAGADGGLGALTGAGPALRCPSGARQERQSRLLLAQIWVTVFGTREALSAGRWLSLNS